MGCFLIVGYFTKKNAKRVVIPLSFRLNEVFCPVTKSDSESLVLAGVAVRIAGAGLPFT